MSFCIDIHKTKSFSVSLTTEGMDISQMQFRFCIELNEVHASFPVQVNGDNLKIVIPPLAEKISNIQPGSYNAYLETYTMNEDNKGYYIRPWQSQIELKKEPKISVDVHEEKDTSLDLKAEIKEDNKPEPPPSYTMKEHSAKQEPVKEWPKKEKNYSKFGKKLAGDE